MPEAIWINGEVLATLLETVPATVEFDEVGISAASLTYLVKWNYAPALVRKLNYHPDFGWLKRVSATVAREEANLAKVDVQFEGIDPEDDDDEQQSVFSLEGNANTEPIEAHPNFHAFAGDWKNPKESNGARFEQKAGSPDKGKFLGFTPLVTNPGGGDIINKFAGIESYLAPGFIYNQRYVVAKIGEETISLDMSKLGEIDTPPDSDVLPTVQGLFEWLLVSATVREVGDGIEVNKKWRLSGKRGWMDEIYDPSTW